MGCCTITNDAWKSKETIVRGLCFPALYTNPRTSSTLTDSLGDKVESFTISGFCNNPLAM